MPGYLYQNNNGSIQCVAVNLTSCSIDNCLHCDPTNSSRCLQCASPYKAFYGQCVCSFAGCLDCSQTVLSCNSCPAPLFGSIDNPNCVPKPSLNNNCTVLNC
jgi:hypothetical protein